MEPTAWQEPEGGEPIDNHTAESLDQFYVSRPGEEPRAFVRHFMAGTWLVNRRGDSDPLGVLAGVVERNDAGYEAWHRKGMEDATASLLGAIRPLLDQKVQRRR